MEIRHHKLNRKTIIIATAVAVVALIAAIAVGIVLKVQYDASFQDKPQITVYSNIDEYEWQYDIAATDVIQIVGQSIIESSPGAPGATAEYFDQIFPPIELPEFTEETDTRSETESEEPSQAPAVETSE